MADTKKQSGDAHGPLNAEQAFKLIAESKKIAEAVEVDPAVADKINKYVFNLAAQQALPQEAYDKRNALRDGPDGETARESAMNKAIISDLVKHNLSPEARKLVVDDIQRDTSMKIQQFEDLHVAELQSPNTTPTHPAAQAAKGTSKPSR